MLIKCPECGFSRSVPEEKIPSGSEFATCPKCEKRFRIRILGRSALGDFGENTGAGSVPSAGDSLVPGPEAGREAEPGGARPVNAPAGDKPGNNDIWSAVESLNELWDRERKEADPAGKAEPDLPGKAGRKEREKFAPREKRSLLANEGSIPWEYSGVFPYPPGLLRTIMLAVTRPLSFFSEVSPKGALLPALLFALLIYTVPIGTAFYRFWSANPSVTTIAPDGTQTVLYPFELLTWDQVVVSLFFTVIFAIFLYACIVSLLTRVVARGRESFRVSFKVSAYAAIPLLLYPLPLVGDFAGSILFGALLCVGLRQAYRLEWSRAVLVLLLFMLSSFALFYMMVRLAASGVV